jgi:hypothetical protein
MISVGFRRARGFYTSGDAGTRLGAGTLNSSVYLRRLIDTSDALF